MIDVSIVIPYFQRRAGILRRAIVSTFNQELPPDVTVEVIVVDDGSPIPASSEIADLTTPEQVTLRIVAQTNAGVAAARNSGLQAVAPACSYVAFLDSDDFWAPGHLSAALAVLERGADIYFCDATRIEIEESYFAASASFAEFRRRYAIALGAGEYDFDAARFFDFCLRARPFHTSTVVYRRCKAPELLFDASLTAAGEDSLFFLQLLQRVERVGCSTAINVTCADGENIFYSQGGWDDPGHLKRQMGQILAFNALLNTLRLTAANRASLIHQRKMDRLKLSFLIARYYLKSPLGLKARPVTTSRLDNTFASWFLWSLLVACIGYGVGFYSPTRRDTRHRRNLYCMRVTIVSSAPYLPQHRSGANTSVSELSNILVSRGHQVSVLAGLLPTGWIGAKARVRVLISRLLTGVRASREMGAGYALWRTWYPSEALKYVVQRERPDVILVAAGEVVRLAHLAMETGVPVHMMLTDVEFDKHGDDFASLGDVRCTANSHFTAKTYADRFGLSAKVILPLIQFHKYQVETSRRYVTFINPHPLKGRDIALAIARQCPEIEFAFVKAWMLSAELEQELAQELASLPNVTLFEARDDMKTIYGECKILLVPSIWNEAYGRVVTEAQSNAIPAVVSARGGLPEAVGPGGVVVDPDGPIEVWVDAIRRLWHDEAYYAETSATALAYAQRPEQNYDFKADAWEEDLLATVARRGRAGTAA